MQHNAGTYLWGLARQFAPCALRACWQHSKHCMISYKEEIEADNIRANYKKFGIQYVSYEMMLPPHFPMPFVSEETRENLFFTTIVRDPFKVRGIAVLVYMFIRSVYLMMQSSNFISCTLQTEISDRH